ncbi:hypothetical protein GF386_05675 [Candidatus Pacearchaeota archaeon]|nr:hypothetical protein [Candidatus Pacearchaeota archaeon]MBD3283583.1 hypothetical protein [Candidatus Pacearchaeota archaeon]
MKRWWIVLIVILIFVLAALSFVKLTGMTVTAVNTCYDSDFGKDYWSVGEVRGEYYLFMRDVYAEEDSCKNNKILIEYYCVDDSSGFHSYRDREKFRCPEGCKDGRCLGEPVEVPRRGFFDIFIFWK